MYIHGISTKRCPKKEEEKKKGRQGDGREGVRSSRSVQLIVGNALEKGWKAFLFPLFHPNRKKKRDNAWSYIRCIISSHLVTEKNNNARSAFSEICQQKRYLISRSMCCSNSFLLRDSSFLNQVEMRWTVPTEPQPTPNSYSVPEEKESFSRAGPYPEDSTVRDDEMFPATQGLLVRTSRRWQERPFALDKESAGPYPDSAPQIWAQLDSALATLPAWRPSHSSLPRCSSFSVFASL